jgi:hypothetical protein
MLPLLLAILGGGVATLKHPYLLHRVLRWVSTSALGETGSLVVQNIFENCLEEDKVRRTGSLQSTKVLTIFYSILASTKSSLVSMSLLMASSATGAFVRLYKVTAHDLHDPQPVARPSFNSMDYEDAEGTDEQDESPVSAGDPPDASTPPSGDSGYEQLRLRAALYVSRHRATLYVSRLRATLFITTRLAQPSSLRLRATLDVEPPDGDEYIVPYRPELINFQVRFNSFRL